MIDSVIDIQELRIGNLLEYKGDLVSITMLSMDIDDEYNEIIGFVKYGTCSNEHVEWNRALALDLKRIPITPEWLERCGWQVVDQGRGPYYWLEKQCWFHIHLSSDGSFYANFNNNAVPILHLHQLQNLYFFLTGEKLPIKHQIAF